MTDQNPNFPSYQSPSFNPPPGQPLPPAPLSPSEERTWAMLAHLSNLLNLFTGFLGALAALIIYLIYKDRSRFVAYQAMQSLLLQLIAWLASGVIAAFLLIIGLSLTFVFVGFLIIPFAILFSLFPIASLVYSVIGAVQTNAGRDFKVWLIGDWVRGVYTQA